MHEEKTVTLGDLEDTVSLITGLFKPFRERLAKTMTPERFAALEADPPNECPNCGAVIAADDNFCDDDCKDAWWGIDKAQIERDRTAGQCEDAEEHRAELAREDFDARMENMIDMNIEARLLERKKNHEQDAGK